MNEHPSDPVARSANTVQNPTGGVPPRHRSSWAAILGWLLLLAVLAGGGLLWVTGFLRFSSDPLTARRAEKYEAEVVLQIHPVKPWVFFGGVPDARSPESLEAYGRTQAALARSGRVLITALKDPKVAELPTERSLLDRLEGVAGQLSVDFSRGPEFMRFTMRGDDEQELTVLLDAIVNAYMNEVVYKEHNERLARINIMQNHQTRIDLQRIVLRELQKATGADRRLMALPQGHLLYHHNTAKELRELVAQIRTLREELQELPSREKAIADNPASNELVEEFVTQDPGVIEKQKAVADLQEQVRQVEKVAEAPASLMAKLESARSALQTLRVAVLPRAKEQARDALLREMRARLAELENSLTMAALLEKDLVADIDRHKRMQQENHPQGPNTDAIRDQVRLAEEIARQALADAARMEVERAAPPRVQRVGDGVTIRKVK